MPWVLLGTLCAATFLVAGGATALAPFLLPMARDLGTDLAQVANLVSILSIAWGVMSLAAGTASDRVGRRPVLVAGVLAMGAARLGLARANTYAAAAAWQLLAGVGGGTYMGTVFAAVSDRVPPAQRGRALGWVITGQSLALVVGVPLVTFVGSFGGWRVAFLAQGAATLAAAAAVWLVVPPGARGRSAGAGPPVSLAKLIDLRILALLGAGVMERSCFAGMAVYLATYLLASYRVSLPGLALALGLIALGNLGGNILGGQVADRWPSRPLAFAVSSLATGLVGLPLMLWQPGLALSVALGFAYSLANAVGRPALMAALSEVPGEVRGAVLGLNITAGSLGWLGATALGGWLIAHFGFASLGLFGALAGLLGAGLAALAWRAGPGRRDAP